MVNPGTLAIARRLLVLCKKRPDSTCRQRKPLARTFFDVHCVSLFPRAQAAAMRWEALQKRLEAVQERRRDRELETRRRMQAADRHRQARERREVRYWIDLKYLCTYMSTKMADIDLK